MPKRFAKAYVEITNICNLSCSFCTGTDRQKQFMTVENFKLIANKLFPFTDYIYLHVLGEPLLHPELREILDICTSFDLKVCLVTNGTLLDKTKDVLLNSPCLSRVSISLHSFEANSGQNFDSYLDSCLSFAKCASDKGIICVLRLWNMDTYIKHGQNTKNADIVGKIRAFFPDGQFENNSRGIRIYPKLFIENAERFEWRSKDAIDSVRCYALKDQIAVLCDGRVVPCCIDCNANLVLGNIFTDEVFDIITSDKAVKLIEGFKNSKAVFDYCKKCGFVQTRLSGHSTRQKNERL